MHSDATITGSIHEKCIQDIESFSDDRSDPSTVPVRYSTA